MAVGALNQLVAGLHSGFDAGMAAGEKGLQKYSGRKMGQAEAALEEYLNYDASVKPGALDAEGTGDSEGKPQMTVRDLNQLRAEYHAAARLTNDPEWAEKADIRWADKLSKGVGSMTDQALRAIEAGDHETAARALERAGGLVPNGTSYKVRKNDKGELVMKGFDELTGQPEDEKVMGAKDIAYMRNLLTDPEKAAEIYTGLEAQAASKRASIAEGKRKDKEFAHQVKTDDARTAVSQGELGLKRKEDARAEKMHPAKRDQIIADIKLKQAQALKEGRSISSEDRQKAMTAINGKINDAIENAISSEMFSDQPQLQRLLVSRQTEVGRVAEMLAAENLDSSSPATSGYGGNTNIHAAITLLSALEQDPEMRTPAAQRAARYLGMGSPASAVPVE